MASVIRSIFPGSTSTAMSRSDDCNEQYSVEYSFAMEYSGPPVNHDIPQVVPIDVRRIPTAAVAAKVLTDLSLPVIQPIKRSEKKLSKEFKLDSQVTESTVSLVRLGTFDSSEEIRSKNLAIGDENSSSSGTLGFSEGRDDSNQLSASSDVEDIDDDCKVALNYSKSTTNSSEIEEIESPALRITPPVVDFHEITQSDVTSSHNDVSLAVIFPERPVAPAEPKGLCHLCRRKSQFSDKEVCIVCGAKYCGKCVIRAMGSMPEGRKCLTCIGYRIDESRRGSLGKSSRLLKRIFVDEAVKQVMKSELSCGVNQLPPHLVVVNDKPLTIEELVSLQSCSNPPKKLRPGQFWYDKVSGFWGKVVIADWPRVQKHGIVLELGANDCFLEEIMDCGLVEQVGEKPNQIITPQLAIGNQIQKNASNGNTRVLINGREITKPELRMLKLAGIHCEGNPHFWVTADGSCQYEGMKSVIGKLWDKKIVKITCKVLSLPFPSNVFNLGSEFSKDVVEVNSKNLDQKKIHRFLLVGSDQSGTSTIFKQAKILYKVPFSGDERENIEYLIQRNLYRYIGIILEGREQFEEDYFIEFRRQHDINQPGPSEIFEAVDERNIYSISCPKLKKLSDLLLQLMVSGNLEAIFPAATREYAPLVEQLWKNEAFQATYRRRNELHKLPRVANYFLDRAVEISRSNYEPSDMDILYAEGISLSNGVASMEFSFPVSSQDSYMESDDQNNPLSRYQLVRVNENNLGGNCKWLEMFEEVNLVLFSVSLTDYAEFYNDPSGISINKILASKKLLEKIATHPSFAQKNFVLILNKFDLLEEKLEQVPLSQCDWFQDFRPVMSLHPHKANSNNNPPLADRAFHYIALKFKRLFTSLTERKLFVVPVTGLEGDSVDKALRYGREVMKWDEEKPTFSMNDEDTTDSIEASTT